MIKCSFKEEITLPNGGYQSSECVDKAEILTPSDPCYGLCFHCAYKKLRDEHKELRETIDSIAVHTLHLLWITDSEKWPELKKYFDAFPRGLKQHVGEIQKHCAEAGSKVAQTGTIEEGVTK